MKPVYYHGHPQVEADVFIVKPSCHDSLPEHEKHNFCLSVVNGHAWGWSVRPSAADSRAMNRKGEFIIESRGHRGNKARRWPLEEALNIALNHVDSRKVNGMTAQQWIDYWASKR